MLCMESLKQYPIADLAHVYDKRARGRTMSGRGSNWLLAKLGEDCLILITK